MLHVEISMVSDYRLSSKGCNLKTLRFIPVDGVGCFCSDVQERYPILGFHCQALY